MNSNEVPEQNAEISPNVLDYAKKKAIIIRDRDVNGKNIISRDT